MICLGMRGMEIWKRLRKFLFCALPPLGMPESSTLTMRKSDLEDPDSRESTGYIISSSLYSIKLQIQNLKRLSRSLQDATPGAKQELAAVSSLVGDVSRYFGSDDAMQKNGVDKKFSGRRALQEARWAAGQ